MKNNPIHNKKHIPNWLFWAISVSLFLPIIVLPPNFQPSDWTRSILFRIILTVLISLLIFSFFYKKNLSVSLAKWDKSAYLPMLVLGGFFVTVILSTLFSQDI